MKRIETRAEMLHQAAETTTQLLNRAAQLPEDTSKIIYTFPDGWTIRQPQTWKDLVREGELVGNCLSPPCEWEGIERDKWSDQDFISDRWEEYAGEAADSALPNMAIYSLRDPNNIPRATLDTELDLSSANLTGRHNSDIKPEYYHRFLDAKFSPLDIFTGTDVDRDQWLEFWDPPTLL